MENLFNGESFIYLEDHANLWEGIAENMFSISIPTYEYS